MAEVQKPLDPGIKIEGEVVPGQETQAENVEPQYTEIEQQAIDQGWRPKDEWEGDPTKWRDAATYIDRGELLGKLKNQGAELREVKQMLAYMSDHNKKVYEAGYRKAIDELKVQRIAAMKDDNFEAVHQIEEAIDQNKQALEEVRRQPPAIPPKQGPNKELEAAWLAKNSWYKTDTAMKAWANGMTLEYTRINPNVDETEVYEFLERQVRKEFPHKFKKLGAPSPDGGGAASNSTKASSGKGNNSDFEKLLSEMPDDVARAARGMVKSGLVTPEKYVEDYARIGGR